MEAVIKEIMGLVTRHGDRRAMAGYADATCEDVVLTCHAASAKSTEAEIESLLRKVLQCQGCAVQQGYVPAGQTVRASDNPQHLFEFWWAEHLPEATQEKAWAAWVAAPETKGVGIAAVQQGVREKREWTREVVQGSVVIRHPYGDSYEFPISTLSGYFAHPTQQGLEQIKQAVRDYHYALDTRHHGGIAAAQALDAVQEALGMRWQQGQEAAARAAQAKQAEALQAARNGDCIRVCVIENDGTSLIVPAEDWQNHTAEIADVEDADPDDEISYTLTFKSMPCADVDALPEFNGF